MSDPKPEIDSICADCKHPRRLHLPAGGTFGGCMAPTDTDGRIGHVCRCTGEGARTVHGIDRRTQEHLCGEPSGLGTDSRQPSMEITCPLCVLVVEQERCPHDGQTAAWHQKVGGTHFDGSPRTNGEFIGCAFGSIGPPEAGISCCGQPESGCGEFCPINPPGGFDG